MQNKKRALLLKLIKYVNIFITLRHNYKLILTMKNYRN